MFRIWTIEQSVYRIICKLHASHLELCFVYKQSDLSLVGLEMSE